MALWDALTAIPSLPLISESFDKDKRDELKWLNDVKVLYKNGNVSDTIKYDGYTNIRIGNNDVRLIDPSISFDDNHDGLLIIDKVYQMIIDNPNFNSETNLYSHLKNYRWRSDFGLLEDFCQDIGHSDVVVCPPEERYTFTNVVTTTDECYFELINPESSIENTELLGMIVEEFVIFSNR